MNNASHQQQQYVCRLSENEKEYVAIHLNEINDKVRQSSVDEIRGWIEGMENLHARTGILMQ